jgi:hypothetical protein
MPNGWQPTHRSDTSSRNTATRSRSAPVAPQKAPGTSCAVVSSSLELRRRCVWSGPDVACTGQPVHRSRLLAARVEKERGASY